jgi:hypothetical protein
MRKVFLSVAPFTVAGLMMLHGAFACELNGEAGQPPTSVVLPGGCNGSNCLVNPLHDDPFTALANEKRTVVDPVQGCGAAFEHGTYSGSNGLLDWLVASLSTQTQYKPGAGFAPSPMDANAQYR